MKNLKVRRVGVIKCVMLRVIWDGLSSSQFEGEKLFNIHLDVVQKC